MSLRNRFIVILITIMGLSSQGHAQKGKIIPVTTWYDSLQTVKKEVFNIYKRDSLIEGAYTLFYRTGELKLEGFFIEGKESGTFKEYYPNQSLRRSIPYQEGKIIGTVSAFDQNGQKIQIGEYKDNVPDGPFKSWYPNGSIQKQGQFRNGEMHGKLEIFSPEGTKKEIIHYIDGKQHGEHLIFHKNEQLLSKSNYQNGKREGLSNTYYPSGQQKSLYTYQNDKVIGDFTTYHSNGQVNMKGNYSKILGKDQTVLDGISIGYYPNGTVKQSLSYQMGKPVGIQKHFHPNGKLKKQTQYTSATKKTVQHYDTLEVLQKVVYFTNEKIEPHLELYSQGKLESKYSFKGGKKNGKAYFYDINQISESGAVLLKTEEYKNNKKIGFETTYHKDEIIASKIRIIKGKKHGSFESFYKNGKIAAKGVFVNDKKQGKWTYYDEDGKEIKTEEYHRGVKK